MKPFGFLFLLWTASLALPLFGGIGPGACAAGVTLITHGWNVGGAPAWLDSMANAVSTHHLDGQGRFGKITVTSSGGNLVATRDPWDFDWAAGTSGEALIVLDWSAVADHLNGGPPTQEVAAAVVDSLVEEADDQPPPAELPIHLIGHSRGGGMICEIARLLGERGIVVDHLTPLDPHPLTQSDPQPLLSPPVIDTPAAIYENVIFADVYLQTTEAPTGEEVSGAFHRTWEEMPGGYYDNGSAFANHRNVYLMYQGTIDLDNPVNNGEAVLDAAERTAWFSAEEAGGDRTGFAFSRIKAARVRPEAGRHEDAAIGGSGARRELFWSGAVWPNIAEFEVRLDGAALGPGDQSVPVGAALKLWTAALDYDGGGTITFHGDPDRNPYNGNDRFAIGGALAVSATAETFAERNMSWDTTSVADGTEIWIRATIADGVRTRFFYAPSHLLFSLDPLRAAVAVLQLLAGLSPDLNPNAIPEINGDARLGLEEAMYHLQEAADLRE